MDSTGDPTDVGDVGNIEFVRRYVMFDNENAVSIETEHTITIPASVTNNATHDLWLTFLHDKVCTLHYYLII